LKPKIICIVGPTASGKSSLAFELAKRLNTEIVSADSRLVYQELNIGTDKPTPETRQIVKHHLIDLLKLDQKYNLVDYFSWAEEILQELLEKKKTPIVVGGTGLYFKALFENLVITKIPENQEYRKSLEKLSTEKIFQNLSCFLNKNSSLRKRFSHIHRNDRFRIIRALEIIENPLNQNKSNNLERKIDLTNLEINWFGLNFLERSLLREKIAKRTFSMVMNHKNLIEETENLLEKYGELELLKKTIGYSECLEYLCRKISTKEELVSKISNSTSQYAKRQVIWFRPNKKIQWINAQISLSKKISKILEVL